MPDQKPRYMQQLDEWTEQEVIRPILAGWREYQDLLDEAPAEAKGRLEDTYSDVRKAVREKVLESYRNGQKAGPRKDLRGRK